MNYAQIREFDITNGPGVRTTLFVSGCTHNCKGCFNKDQQNFLYGEEWTKEVEDRFIKLSQNKQIVGINILGGEPMQQDSKVMLNLVKRLKEEVNKPIWVWTGNLFEELSEKPDKLEILKYIDVLIDGKFELEKRDLMLQYRGSKNQRVIDIKKTFEIGDISLYE